MCYSPIICPHCSQETQFDFDSPSCFCIRCGQAIQREASAVADGLITAADRAFACMSFSEARELYSNAILAGNTDPYLCIRKAVCGALVRQDPAAMNELIATYAQCDSPLRDDPEGLPKRRMLAGELLHFLQSPGLFTPRDSSMQPFSSMAEARDYCLHYCAVFELVKDLYKYVPYDLLDEREALSRFTQQFCSIAAQRVYYYQGSSRVASGIANATRMAATQTWNECANDLNYTQSLRLQQGQAPSPAYMA